MDEHRTFEELCDLAENGDGIEAVEAAIQVLEMIGRASAEDQPEMNATLKEREIDLAAKILKLSHSSNPEVRKKALAALHRRGM